MEKLQGDGAAEKLGLTAATLDNIETTTRHFSSLRGVRSASKSTVSQVLLFGITLEDFSLVCYT